MELNAQANPNLCVKNTFLDLDDAPRMESLQRYKSMPNPTKASNAASDDELESQPDSMEAEGVPQMPELYRTVTCDGYEPAQDWSWASGLPTLLETVPHYTGAPQMPPQQPLQPGAGQNMMAMPMMQVFPMVLLPATAMYQGMPGLQVGMHGMHVMQMAAPQPPPPPGQMVAVPVDRFARWPAPPPQDAPGHLQSEVLPSGSMITLEVDRDRPGLLSEATELLRKHGLNIREAKIMTLDGADGAKHVYQVQDKQTGHGLPAARLEEVRSALEGLNAGRCSAGPWQNSSVEEAQSGSSMVTLDVDQDRAGLMSEASDVMKKHGCDIRVAKISTMEGSRAQHIYQVQDKETGGGLATERLAEIQSALEGLGAGRCFTGPWPVKAPSPSAMPPMNMEFASRAPVLQKVFSVSSCIYRVRWTVDARILKSTDREKVSPPFELSFTVPVQFKLVLRPKSIGDGRGQAAFKKCRGLGLVDLRCLAEVRDGNVNPTVCFRIGVGGGNDLSKQSPPRGPVRADFTMRAIASLPPDMEEWDLAKAVDEATQTFVICLEVLSGPAALACDRMAA